MIARDDSTEARKLKFTEQYDCKLLIISPQRANVTQCSNHLPQRAINISIVRKHS